MSPLEAALLMAILVLPFHFAVQYQLDRLDDPAWLREHGVVIVKESALSGHADPIGKYRGHEIWRAVTFKGMTYRFDHVARPAERERIHARELYLEPGLVYLTD